MKRWKHLLPIAVLMLATLAAAAGRPSFTRTESAELKSLGKSYAPVLASTYADAWRAAAETLENGGTVTQAQKALQQDWTERRARAFKTQVTPVLSRFLPEGTEPTDAAERARVAAAWRAFAAGLKSAR